MKSVRSIAVWCVLTYLRVCAWLALRFTTATIIGIAGSVGKSSTRNAIAGLLQHQGTIRIVSGNSETGVPLGILGVHVRGYQPWDWIIMLVQAPLKIRSLRSVQYLIIEMGTDDILPPKNMEYLLSIVKPHIAVWLNVAPTHMMQFGHGLTGNGSMQEMIDTALQRMAQEDGKMITASGCRTAIYNADNTYIANVLEQHATALHDTVLKPYGDDTASAVSYQSYELTPSSTRFVFTVQQGSHTRNAPLELKQMLLPQEYREVFAATILVGLSVDIPLATILSDIEAQFSLPKGRASVFTGMKDSIIIDSTYNSSPAPLRAFLQLARQLRTQTHRKIVFLFGDMNELGATSEFEHTAIAKELDDMDAVYCVGPQTKEYAMPLLKKAQWFESSWELGEHLKTHLPEQSIVLAKGSQNRVFLEEAIKPLLQNPADQSKLCRQEPYWLTIKKKGHFLQLS